MFNRYSYITFSLLITFSAVFGQPCELTISGSVRDAATGNPIEFANIYLQNTQQGTISDHAGKFFVHPVCQGEHHLIVSHIGCETREFYIQVSGDTTLEVLLDHQSLLLDEISITGEASSVTIQESHAMGEKRIAENMHENLANLVDHITGVSVIRNGNAISKPVVHGLYGNRLTILNNGIAQSGQQWGVDHSPEIDPLAANRITLVKGVGALEYQGNSLGSIILVEPSTIKKDPHLHGKARYFFESNGLSHGLNVQLQQFKNKTGWRAIGTLKKSGDRSTPDYYLRNTGVEEGNLAMQLESSIGDQWKSDFYFSSFNTRLGILRGSHIGNITDLDEALNREVPFYTEDGFSYSIEAPQQRVNHHLLKLHSKYLIGETHWLDLTYAVQLNLRKEFDVRRSGRSDLPALSLKQYSHFFEAKYEKLIGEEWSWKTGFQFNFTDNSNLPETGILPLIPDYLATKPGVFGLLSKNSNKTSLEFSFRYDFEDRSVASISSTLPREIIRYDNQYHHFGFAGGMTQRFFDSFGLTWNAGYTSRNPEVNELYSNGLHQGVSGIELGDPELSREKSFKTTLSADLKTKDKFSLETILYFHNIGDYIYLRPEDKLRLTIRGAFPVFQYAQTDARIWGMDWAATYEFNSRLNAVVKYSYIRGDDTQNDVPLVLMPSNNFYSELNYLISKLGDFENVELQINQRWTFKQSHLLDSQDFLPPPEGYFLLGLKLNFERQFTDTRLDAFVRAENLFNTTYREYLNRHRYFADDLGTNVILGLNFSF